MPAPWVTDEDYAALRGFFAYFALRQLDLDDPLAPLEQVEAAAPKRAASALRLAIQDCLELSAALRPAQIRAADEALAARGLPTLSQVRVAHWRRAQVALSREAIRTEAERAAIRGLADSAVEEALRVRCLGLLQAFEARVARRWPLRAHGRN